MESETKLSWKNNEMPTMYKKHKWLSGLRNFRAFNQLRQICDLTGCFNTLNLALIANLAQCNLIGKSFEITYVYYIERWAQLKTT
jgi:hypothetical protein